MDGVKGSDYDPVETKYYFEYPGYGFDFWHE